MFLKKSAISLLPIPIIFFLLQFWASHGVISHLPPHRITDGVHYIMQSWSLRVFGIHLVRDGLRFGLYPAFLGLFKIPNLDWATGGANSVLINVYIVQAFLLAATTAGFLWCSIKFIAGSALKRYLISLLLGGILLSPLVIVWPSGLLMESLTLSALLLFASACIAYDTNRKHSLVFIGLFAGLSILIRDPIIFFFWIFAGLFGLNILVGRMTKTRTVTVGLVMLLLSVGLGGIRAMLNSTTGKYVQPLVNIIQLRILPDPERRRFFFDHGLSMSPTVAERSGKEAQFNNTWFEPDNEVPPDFVVYRKWIIANGFRTYAAFLLAHPDYLVRSMAYSPNIGPSDQFATDFSFSITDLFSIPSRGYWIESVPYPPWLRDFLLVPMGWLLPTLYLAVAAVRYVVQTTGRKRASSMEIVAIAAWLSLFVTYHTDGLDFWRHTVPFVVLIYLSLIVRVPEIAKEVLEFAMGQVRAFRGGKTIPAAGGAEPSASSYERVRASQDLTHEQRSALRRK